MSVAARVRCCIGRAKRGTPSGWLDSTRGMLDIARTRSDIEWILGDLTTVAWEREFDLAVMTGHAFQELVEDDQIRASLAAIHSALADDGVFAFETRNALAREWEQWTPEHGIDFVGADGAAVRFETEVETPVLGDVVRFTSTYTSAGWNQPERSTGALRFLDAGALSSFLSDAGFVIGELYWRLGQEPVREREPGDHHHRAPQLKHRAAWSAFALVLAPLGAVLTLQACDI